MSKKTIYKILTVQIGVLLGEFVCFYLFNFTFNNIITSHVFISGGYLFGLYDND